MDPLSDEEDLQTQNLRRGVEERLFYNIYNEFNENIDIPVNDDVLNLNIRDDFILEQNVQEEGEEEKQEDIIQEEDDEKISDEFDSDDNIIMTEEIKQLKIKRKNTKGFQERTKINDRIQKLVDEYKIQRKEKLFMDKQKERIGNRLISEDLD